MSDRPPGFPSLPISAYDDHTSDSTVFLKKSESEAVLYPLYSRKIKRRNVPKPFKIKGLWLMGPAGSGKLGLSA